MVHLQQREVNINEAKLTLQGLRQHYVYPWRCWGSTRWHQYSCHRLSNPLFFSYPWSHTIALLKLLNILIIKYTGEQGMHISQLSKIEYVSLLKVQCWSQESHEEYCHYWSPKGYQEPGGKINQDTGDKFKCCTILKRAVLQVSVQEGFKGKLHERTDLCCQGTIRSCL